MKKFVCILLVCIVALLCVSCNNASANQNDQGHNSLGNGTQDPDTSLSGGVNGEEDYDPNISKEILYGLDLELTRNPLKEAYYSCQGPEDRLIQGKVSVSATYEGQPVVSIWINAFVGCKSVTEVTIEEGLRYIYRQSFTFCTGLNKLSLPGTIERIDMEAFAGCSSLTEIVFDGTKSQWEAIEKGENWAPNSETCIVRCHDGEIKLTNKS